MENRIVHFLMEQGGDIDDSWQPFEQWEIMKMLKATTLDLSGVGITVTKLRSAAESHVDILQYDSAKESENIQRALSYAEGHSESIAKLFYKRNGSSSIMSWWTKYVES